MILKYDQVHLLWNTSNLETQITLQLSAIIEHESHQVETNEKWLIWRIESEVAHLEDRIKILNEIGLDYLLSYSVSYALCMRHILYGCVNLAHLLKSE